MAGMNEFIELRKRAREKRDKAVAQAQAAFTESMALIDALEHSITGNGAASYQTLSQCVDRVIPPDREFTVAEIMAALVVVDPDRSWCKRSINEHIARLRQRSVLRLVKRATGSTWAVYARADLALPERPFQGMTLRDAISSMLAKRPMTPIELTVALREDGWQTKLTPTAFRNAVGKTLREHPAEFVKTDGKWAVEA